MAETFSPASQTACAARSHSLFAKADGRSGGRKRSAVLRNAHGSSGPARRPRQKLLPGWVVETVARGRSHGGLHDFARRPSSRAGLYARTSARIPLARQGRLRDLGLGKIVEGVRLQAPAMRI